MVKGKAGPRPGPVSKKPKADKKPKETKAKADKAAVTEDVKASPPANEPKADPDMGKLARHHAETYVKRKAALSKAQTAMRQFGAKVKSDGLSMRQIKLMVELLTPEGEAAWRSLIANDLIAAQYQGAAIGQQLALFLEPDRTPSSDMAYEEGQRDSIDGKTCKPGYDPSTEQFRRYTQGYDDETARRIKTGIKSDVKPNPTRAETLAASRDKAAQAAESDKFH